MTVFDDYAEWYDLFYEDKDYRGEAAFVTEVLASQGGAGRELLEVGCGTGAHARWLVGSGWRLVGIDRSERMLVKARARLAEAGAADAARFVRGDARTFSLGETFDTAVSLFHVMSYQAGPGDLEAALASVRRHLRPGGLFLFDFWYGPAVLAQRPEQRQGTAENARFRVRRTAIPALREDDHVVDVRYVFDVVDKLAGTHREVQEVHPMRYLLPDEMAGLAGTAGFMCLSQRAWMEDRAPDAKTWAAFALLRVDD